jgi:hypothetical protein
MEDCKDFPSSPADRPTEPTPAGRPAGNRAAGTQRKKRRTGRKWAADEPDFAAMAKARGFGPLVRRAPGQPDSERVDDAEERMRRASVVWNYAVQKADPPTHPNADFMRELARAGKHYAPPWWIEATTARNLVPEDLLYWRRYVLYMTQEHAAAFFRVPVATIRKWEAGEEPIPYAVAYVLRNLPERDDVRLSRPGFHDWGVYTDPQTGVPKLFNRHWAVEFSSAQLTFYAQAMQSLASVEADRDRLRAEVESLQSENNRLREMFKAGEITEELHAMRERLSAILARVNIADVVPLDEARGRKAA